MKTRHHFNTEIISRISAKQIDLLYNHQPVSILSTIFVISALFFFLYTPEIEKTLTAIYLYFWTTIILRFFANWRYLRNRKNNTVNIDKAYKIYLAGIIANGIGWSLIIFLVFPTVNLAGEVLLLIAVMGFSAGAHTTLGFKKLPLISFAFLLTVPLVYVVYHSELPNATAIIIAIIFQAIFVLRSSLMFYNSTYTMLGLIEIAAQRERELKKQTAEANSANKEKSEFLSRMSHELRTPLNAVLGMNELLIRDSNEPLSEKQAARAHKINNAGKHLLSIVDDVLDLSRIEAGCINISLGLTDCQTIIDESIKLIENKAIAKEITITSEISRAEAYAIADAKRLKQVIVNLLDNAIKYNKHGGQVKITLNAYNESFIRISVTDTGYGIPQESINKLFLPFSRLNSEHIDIDGNGIGLSLCKQFAELMNGNIGLECQQGKGCCFWIEIPRAKQKAHIPPDEKPNYPDAPINTTKNNNRILLVEDNEINREVATDMLEELGYEVDIAVDGKQATSILTDKSYALVLMDCEMPVMDGFTATKKIREEEKQRSQNQEKIIIIALTAHAIGGTKEKCLDSGMNDFLSKPFSMSTLQKKLNQWLS